MLEGQFDLKDIVGFYQKGYGNFWVVVDGGKVVGIIFLFDIGNVQVVLCKMFVVVSYCGKEYGIVVCLLEGVIVWVCVQGVCQIYLGIMDKFLVVYCFYEKNGFCFIEKSMLLFVFLVMVVDICFYVLDC